MNSTTKSLRERDQSELPVRRSTHASTTRIYPSQSGKNRYAVRIPGNVQFNGQQIASRPNPNQPCSGHTGAGFATVVPFIHNKMSLSYTTLKHRVGKWGIRILALLPSIRCTKSKSLRQLPGAVSAESGIAGGRIRK